MTAEQRGDDATPISLNDWESALKSDDGAVSRPESAPASDTTAGLDAVFSQLGEAGAAGDGGGIDLVMDIPISVSVELGRVRIPVKSIVQLGQGSVVELEGRAGDPLDIYANGALIARGEVVIVNDRFGVRLTELVKQGRPKKWS